MTVPMPVVVVFPLFGEKFDGSGHASLLRMLQRPLESWIGQSGIEQVSFPRQLLRRMRVGIGKQRISVQRRETPDHGRVSGQSCFQRVYLRRQIPEAFLDGVEAGIFPKQGKMRCPDMGRDKDSRRTDLQRDFQQVAAVQPQNRPSVRMQVAHLLQTAGQRLRFLQARKENDVVHLAHLIVLFIYAADFPCHHKAGTGQLSSQAVVLPEGLLQDI